MAKVIVIETAFSTYRLKDGLGEGGAGKVFAATDESGRPWAVKLLASNRATSERRKRFKNEILFSERTKHPNVVQVIDHGVAALDGGPTPFYVMPRYAGSLRSVLGKLGDPAARLNCFDQVLSGVEAAHLVGVFHRDIKPENILRDEGATLFVVADWGIAHFTDEELYTAAETAPGSRLANFLYAAPEQRLRGHPVDARADVYALGLLLNELFTGSVPQGTGYRTIAEGYPDYAWLDPLVEAMISQQPDRRPASIDAIKRTLIAHRQEFVTRQRLDEIQKTVVETAAVTEPLAETPPRLVDFDWENGQLTLILDRAVNRRWVEALYRMGSYSSVVGKGPENFVFDGKQARVAARDYEVQDVINWFKTWLPLATNTYRETLEREKREAEERQRSQLQAEQAELERRQRVKSSIKL